MKLGKIFPNISENDEVALEMSFPRDTKNPSSSFSGSVSDGISGGLTDCFWYGGVGAMFGFVV